MITLTDTAAEKVAQLIEAEGAEDVALRVSVKSGGCSGFSYDMYFDTDIAPDDVTLTFGNVKVVVDPASAPMLEGATWTSKTHSPSRALQSPTRTQRVLAVAVSHLANSVRG